MITPITEYDARLKKSPHIKRERNGRRSRSAVRAEYMVYFVRIDGNPLLKVGRTRNLAARIGSYEQHSGRIARAYAQLIVESAHDSLLLERHAIAALGREYRVSRREWFLVPLEEIGKVVDLVKKSAPVPIIGVRGAPGAEEEPIPIALKAARETLIACHQRKQTRAKLYAH